MIERERLVCPWCLAHEPWSHVPEVDCVPASRDADPEDPEPDDVEHGGEA